VSQNGLNLLARHDDGQSLRFARSNERAEHAQFAAEHAAVEKQESAERLILRRRADIPIDGEMCQEGVDLGLTHGGGVTQPVELDEPARPAHVCAMGPAAVMA